MTRVYATPADYQQSTGQAPPSGVGALLTSASRMLEANIFRFCYFVADSVTGLPTDPQVLAAFRDAVCAQVQWWGEVGDSIGIGGIGTYDEVRIGSMILRGPRVKGPGATSAARSVAPAAMDILQSMDLPPYKFQFGVVIST